MTVRLRRILLLVVAGLLYHSGLLRLRLLVRRAFFGRQEAFVLALHRVLSEEEEKSANSLSGMVLRERTFDRMLDFLGRKFRVVSLDDFLERLSGHHDDSKPLCLLTFDDGWRDNYTTAYPCLSKRKMAAVIFLVTGWVDKEGGFWVEKLHRAWQDPARQQWMREWAAGILGNGPSAVNIEALIDHLKHMPTKERTRALATLMDGLPAEEGGSDRMLNWEDIAVMQRDGIDFEAHSVTHPLLVYEDDETVQDELRGSKQAIEERLRKQVRAFAYPNGTWDERVREHVQNTGYTCAFTTRRDRQARADDPYTIPRIILHEAKVVGLDGQFSPAVLSLRLTGWI
jgi:peptidoglycan/xylan/chitin deacetylase (PgdA/CDA1 family)